MNKIKKLSKKNILISILIILIFSILLIVKNIYNLSNNKYGHFEKTGELNKPRRWHTATLLPDGNVLITGGTWRFHTLTSIELYLTKEGRFIEAGNLKIDRDNHTATLLPDGNVLIMGGSSDRETIERMVKRQKEEKIKRLTLKNSSTGETLTLVTHSKKHACKTEKTQQEEESVTQNVELYNPKTHISKIVGKLKQTYTSGSTAILLPNGKVFIYGSYRPCAEIYDPKTNTSKLTSKINYVRSASTATILKDGRILITGDATKIAEIYNYKTAKFSLASTMIHERGTPVSILLNDDNVLVAGGYNDKEKFLLNAEIYNVKNNKFKLIPNLKLPSPNKMSKLNNGMIFITGAGKSEALIFDPIRENFIKIGKALIKRAYNESTTLSNGNVLITGGIPLDDDSSKTKTAELFKLNK